MLVPLSRSGLLGSFLNSTPAFKSTDLLGYGIVTHSFSVVQGHIRNGIEDNGARKLDSSIWSRKSFK